MRIVIATGGVMPILLGCGLGGCSDPKQQQLDVTAAAARAQQNIARYAADSRPGRHPVGTTKIAAATPETLPEAAAAVVRRYYQRIAAHDFVGARALWCRDGESSTLDRAGFAHRFARYARYNANIAAPGSVDAGAGQLHISVPVRVTGTLSDGTRFADDGMVLLHRVNDGIETASAEAHLWRIESTSVDPVIPPPRAPATSAPARR
ncbi:hypothetical protein QTN93_15665 [Sphingomonas aerolata]|uniref:hypothetical protein n=1 Tax=Sphingomonas aerolata TaxID=185951 RepID=UPI0035A5DC83